MKWILVIILSGYGFGTSTTAEFSDKERCEAAAQWVKSHRIGSAACFAKSAGP